MRNRERKGGMDGLNGGIEGGRKGGIEGLNEI